MTFRSFIPVLMIAFFVYAGTAQAQSALHAVMAHRQKLRNITVLADMHMDVDLDPDMEFDISPAERQRKLERGVYKHLINLTTRFRYLDGIVRCEMEMDPSSKAAHERKEWQDNAYDSRAVFPDRIERIVRHTGTTQSLRQWINSRDAREPLHAWSIDLALGLRQPGRRTWLEPADLQKAELIEDPQGVTLQSAIEGTTARAIFEMRFEKQYGYALTSSRRTLVPASGRPPSVQKVVGSDFRQVQGVFVPWKIVHQLTAADTKGRMRNPYTYTYTVREFKVDDPANTYHSMQLVWGAATEVHDSRHGAAILIGPTSRPLE